MGTVWFTSELYYSMKVPGHGRTPIIIAVKLSHNTVTLNSKYLLSHSEGFWCLLGHNNLNLLVATSFHFHQFLAISVSIKATHIIATGFSLRKWVKPQERTPKMKATPLYNPASKKRYPITFAVFCSSEVSYYSLGSQLKESSELSADKQCWCSEASYLQTTFM